MKRIAASSARATARTLGHILVPLVLGCLAAGGVLWLRMLAG